ncbi:hypothetical protein GQX74_003776 [Glossina fuscipes]|nr:hypothetical protein GQX74_003776 [Glossina fuscipes]
MHSCFYSSSEITQELLLTLSNETNSHICDTVELGVHCAANFLVECFPLLKFKCIHFSTIAHNDDDDDDDDDDNDDDDDDDDYNDDDNEYFENVYNTLVYRGIGIGILSEMRSILSCVLDTMLPRYEILCRRGNIRIAGVSHS